MKTATKTFYLLILTFLILTSGKAFSQDDFKNSKLVTPTDANMTAEERQKEKTIKKTERNIPANLLQQLENAKDNGGDVKSIQAQIDSYNTGVEVLETKNAPEIHFLDREPGIVKDSWLTEDVLVYQNTTNNYQKRTLDMKQGPDGNLYLAILYNGGNSYIRIYKSTDGGATWNQAGGVTSNGVFGTLSMLVENRHESNMDSVRAIVYYTFASDNTFDGARVGFISITPNAANTNNMGGMFLTPAAGNEFNYVSAVSDGQYYDDNTYFGVVTGEYDNSGACINLRYSRTINWGGTHSSVIINTPYNDHYPTASFKGTTGDSVFIAVERRFTDKKEVRVLKTAFNPNASYNTIFLTSDSADYQLPVINIKQDAQSLTKRMIITCMKDRLAVYHYSSDGGATWAIDATLNSINARTTNYTWITSDSTTDGGGYFMAVFADSDSINVRRGVPGSLGAVLRKQNTHSLTTTASPVCVILNQGGVKSSSLAYWGFGPANVYFNAENLTVGINNISEIADSYELKQNYPNPFNPSTNINFSIPKAGIVTLKIFDISGREVATLVNQNMTPGTYNVDFDGSKLSSGAYFYRLETGSFAETKKMLLVK